MVDFNQHNYAHQYDLWEHSLQTVVGLPKNIEDDMVYLAALIHDIGKPDCQSYDERDGTTAVHIDDLLKALEPAGIMFLDKTGIAPDGSRTKEIDFYLRRHPEERYIILDDDPTLFDQPKNTPHLYLTSSKTGLTDADVDRILKKINQ